MEVVHLGDRRYLLFRPPAGESGGNSQRWPVVVLLHGTGGTAEWADDEIALSAFACRERFLLAIPDALPPNREKPPKFLTNPQRWNDGTPASDPVSTESDDVGFLTAVVADVLRRGPGNPRRVYVTGFSNGAGMTFRFAAERAELLTAIAPVAGYCRVPDPRPSRPIPTLFVIGEADPLVPPAGGLVRSPWGGKVQRPPISDTLERWAIAVGCQPIPRPDRWQDGVQDVIFPGPVEFRVVTIAGLGHHWPGGKGQLDPRFGGPASGRVDGNELVWSFFHRHGG